MQGKLTKYIEIIFQTTSMRILQKNLSKHLQSNGIRVLRGLVNTNQKMEYWTYRMDH